LAAAVNGLSSPADGIIGYRPCPIFKSGGLEKKDMGKLN
jgi:hypothetical protein